MAGRAAQRARIAEFDQAVAEYFMRLALDEAARALGRTAPNPVVGALLVKGGRILSRGYHRKAGTAHAEVVALEAAGARARGADLYTTLEPCNHWGKTPPCTQAILEAGVRRVICGSADPNPVVSGKGVARLRRAGVEVLTGVLREEADRLNWPFFKHVVSGLPWVTLKAAVTLDGKLATANGDSKWVTGEAARERVHRLRDRADVILIGAGTARADDPRLTTRLPGGEGRDALRVVVDSRLSLSPKLQLFTQRSPAQTIVATLEPEDGKKAQALARLGTEVWRLPAREGRVDLAALLKRLGERGLMHVLVEGGATLNGALLRDRLADEVALFVAPKLAGDEGLGWAGRLGLSRMADAVTLERVTHERIGEDFLIRGQLPWAHLPGREARPKKPR
jgi:diaminohydroxyphosphoribosylaminopyrimidine deaminase/5-amino-6-(5-phosphoribosylamino)uracil reductase